MEIHRLLTSIQTTIFNYVVFISYILFFLIAFGLSAKAPQYLDSLQYYVKIYISLFLIYRFNPFRHVKFTELDRKVAFSSGLFLFTTTAINQIIQAYIKEIGGFINKYI